MLGCIENMHQDPNRERKYILRQKTRPGKRNLAYGQIPILYHRGSGGIGNVITGNKNSGKTTYLKNLYENTLKGDGFLCIKHFEKKNFIGYDLLHLKTNEQMSFIRMKENLPIDWNEIFEIGIFSFSKEGLEYAKNIIENTKKEPIFIDEIGPLEILKKKGFYELMKLNLGKELYITVREALFDEMLKTFNITKNINKITIK